MSAHIFQINISNGGVPKRAVDRATIEPGIGIVGDNQSDRVHHGGPLQDLCLFRLETILVLQREGHPIYPGAVGENLTIFGLEEENFLPGRHLRLGDEILIELTEYAVPCSKVKAYFRDGRFSRISAKISPESGRMYARVLDGGHLGIGDRIDLSGNVETQPESSPHE